MARPRLKRSKKPPVVSLGGLPLATRYRSMNGVIRAIVVPSDMSALKFALAGSA
jgi:hypothetical protein